MTPPDDDPAATTATSDAAAFYEAALRELQRPVASPNADRFPDERWQRIADAGWLRVLLPEHQGGLGLGVPELGAIFRAVGRVPLRGPLLDAAVTLPLLAGLRAEQHLPQLEEALDGRSVVSVVDALPPPYGRHQDALRIVNGRLSGIAELVPFGAAASGLVVMATRDDVGCIVFVAAQQASTQLVVSADPSVDYARVQFDSVAITEAEVLVDGPEATALMHRARGIHRLMIAAELAGAVEALTAMAVDYAKMRQQFGRPIGSFQALQHMLATLAVRSSALSNLVTWSLLDAQAEPARLDDIALIAKAYACDTGRYAAEECLQVHGAIGFTDALPLHRHYRRVLTHQGFLGETDALLRRVGERTLNEYA